MSELNLILEATEAAIKRVDEQSKIIGVFPKDNQASIGSKIALTNLAIELRQRGAINTEET